MKIVLIHAELWGMICGRVVKNEDDTVDVKAAFGAKDEKALASIMLCIKSLQINNVKNCKTSASALKIKLLEESGRRNEQSEKHGEQKMFSSRGENRESVKDRDEQRKNISCWSCGPSVPRFVEQKLMKKTRASMTTKVEKNRTLCLDVVTVLLQNTFGAWIVVQQHICVINRVS